MGGGIANTFLAAQGLSIGNSLCEYDCIADAQRIMLKTNILLPTDVMVGQEFSECATATLKATEEISSEDMILDIGPVSAKKLANILSTREPFYGMDLLVYLNLINLEKALEQLQKQLPTVKDFLLLEAEILWRQYINMVLLIKFRMYPQAEALFWNT